VGLQTIPPGPIVSHTHSLPFIPAPIWTPAASASRRSGSSLTSKTNGFVVVVVVVCFNSAGSLGAVPQSNIHKTWKREVSKRIREIAEREPGELTAEEEEFVDAHAKEYKQVLRACMSGGRLETERVREIERERGGGGQCRDRVMWRPRAQKQAK
jgi:hypothetical protein